MWFMKTKIQIYRIIININYTFLEIQISPKSIGLHLSVTKTSFTMNIFWRLSEIHVMSHQKCFLIFFEICQNFRYYSENMLKPCWNLSNLHDLTTSTIVLHLTLRLIWKILKIFFDNQINEDEAFPQKIL